jgi:putative MFS transporter
MFYSIATLAMALMPSALLIDVFRFVAGIGIGVQIITIDAYVSEITPAANRGKFIAFSQFVSYTSVPIVALLAMLFVPHQFGPLAGWRIVAIIGALGAIAVWPIRAGLPESPRWLESHGRREEADRILREFEERAGVRPAVERSRERGRYSELRSHATEASGSWLEIWRPPYRTRTIMLVIFNFFQTIGFYGFASWVPLLLYQNGVTYVRDLQYVLIIALANPFGPVIAILAADKLQRKWQIVILAAAIAAFGLLFARARAASAIVVLGILITLANNWFSAAFHAYQAELFPTRIRTLAVGFVYSWSRFSAIFASIWISLILGRYGVTGVFTLIAIAMSIVAIVIAAMGQKTNRLQLEVLAP